MCVCVHCTHTHTARHRPARPFFVDQKAEWWFSTGESPQRGRGSLNPTLTTTQQQPGSSHNNPLQSTALTTILYNPLQLSQRSLHNNPVHCTTLKTILYNPLQLSQRSSHNNTLQPLQQSSTTLYNPLQPSQRSSHNNTLQP